MAMTTVDERLLVEAHNGGDSEAFVSIVNEYSSSLYAHAMMRLGEPRAAEDAVQETFLRAYRAMPRFEGEFHLRAWLHRILTNVCFDEGDRRRREIRTFDRAAGLAEPDGASGRRGPRHRPRRTRNAKSPPRSRRCPIAYREALELRYVEQLSFREVADVHWCLRGERTRSCAPRSCGAASLDQRAVRIRGALHPGTAQGRARRTGCALRGRQPELGLDDVDVRAVVADDHPPRRRAERSDVDEGRHRRRCRRSGNRRRCPGRVQRRRAHVRHPPRLRSLPRPHRNVADAARAPQDTVVVVDQTPTAPIVDPATLGTPTDAATNAADRRSSGRPAGDDRCSRRSRLRRRLPRPLPQPLRRILLAALRRPVLPTRRPSPRWRPQAPSARS